MKAFFASRKGIIVVGIVIGSLAALLQKGVLLRLGLTNGNPPNMGVCVACFNRDIAGAIGLHSFAKTQYIRPEIIGLVLGALVAALAGREWRPRGGSSPLIRFVLGALAMIGALVFLGCPWRALLRLAGGDLNAIVGLGGLITGIYLGSRFMKAGFSLGKNASSPKINGLILPGCMLLLLGLLLSRTSFGPGKAIFFSKDGPGAMMAPIWISLGAGLLIGVLGQLSRFCTVGAFRDLFLIRNTRLLSGLIATVLAALTINLIFGLVQTGFSGMPISHSDHLWNFLGMLLAGLAFSLGGGCPGRQCFLAGEGDSDAGIFLAGMLVGAGFAHNWSLAAGGDHLNDGLLTVGGPGIFGQIAVIAGIVFCLILGLTARDKTRTNIPEGKCR